MDNATSRLLNDIIECVHFAAVKHRNQRRQDSAQTPYVNHVIGVARILTYEGRVRDPSVIQAALLHDTVEDTDTTFDEISEIFGENVAAIVSECTDDKRLPKEERKRLQIVNAPCSSPEAKLVKLADKLYNLRDLETEIPIGWNAQRVREYYIWAYQVFEGLRGTNKPLEKKLEEFFEKHDVRTI